MNTTSTATNLSYVSGLLGKDLLSTYPAVAANTSIVFANVQYDRTNAKNVVKQSIAPIRFNVVSMRYNPNIASPGKREARTDVGTFAADLILDSG
jgi:hypothetical protein